MVGMGLVKDVGEGIVEGGDGIGEGGDGIGGDVGADRFWDGCWMMVETGVGEGGRGFDLDSINFQLVNSTPY